MLDFEPREYWDALLRYMKSRGMLVTYRESTKESRQVIDTWKANTLDVGLNPTENWIHVDITLRDPHREYNYISLEKLRDRYEGEISKAIADLDNTGSEWIWKKEPGPKLKESHIILRRPVNLNDRTDWKKQFEWLGRAVVAFRESFGEQIKQWEGIR
jgi:hypothetical protein